MALTRRAFLALLAGLASIPVIGRAIAAPPDDFCLKHPNHPRCRPSPTPTPSPTVTPSPSPSPSPAPSGFGPTLGRDAVVAAAGARPVVAPAGGISFTSAEDLKAKIAAT